MPKINLGIKLVLTGLVLTATLQSLAAPARNAANSPPIIKPPSVLSPDEFKSQVKTIDTQNKTELKKQADEIIASAPPPPLPPAPKDKNKTAAEPTPLDKALDIKPESKDQTATTNSMAPINPATPPAQAPINNTPPASSPQNVTGFGATSASSDSGSNTSDNSNTGLDIKY